MTNMIANGTFESNITGWTALSSTIARDTTVFHSGVASLKITASAASGGAYPAAITTVVGTTYRTTLWVRGTGTFNIGMSSGSAFVAYSPNYVLSTTWQQVIFDWTATIASVLVYPELAAAGQVANIDDVSFDLAPVVVGAKGGIIRAGVKTAPVADSILLAGVKKTATLSDIVGATKKAVL